MKTSRAMAVSRIPAAAAAAGALLLAAACGSPTGRESHAVRDDGMPDPGPVLTVADTTVAAVLWASGSAEPLVTATLATKLMGTVEEVLVREGDRVSAGAPLVRIDARELAARRAQVEAGIREAEAVVEEARTHAGRMSALFEDEAATRAQLDAALTALARAEAGVRTARAGAAEVAAVSSYAILRAPFDGVVTERLVDPGAFATPGTPLVTVTDASRLRIVVTAPPEAVRSLARGDALEATIEGFPASAVVEGVVPTRAGSLYTVNAIVENPDGRHLPGSAAALGLAQGQRQALLVPASAIVRRGDLTGVRLLHDGRQEIRWVRLGATRGELVEVVSGLRPGERIALRAEA